MDRNRYNDDHAQAEFLAEHFTGQHADRFCAEAVRFVGSDVVWVERDGPHACYFRLCDDGRIRATSRADWEDYRLSVYGW